MQREQETWADKNFPNNNRTHQLLGIVEEVGELCHAHLKFEQNIRTNEPHAESKCDALGDIFIFMLGYANKNGIDLQAAIEETWTKVKQRDWTVNSDTGTPVVMVGDTVEVIFRFPEHAIMQQGDKYVVTELLENGVMVRTPSGNKWLGFEHFNLIKKPSEEEFTEYNDPDATACVDDYNRFEENQVFQDREDM